MEISRKIIVIGVIALTLIILLIITILVLTRPKFRSFISPMHHKQDATTYYPYIASVSLKNGTKRKFACAGAIVSTEWVLVDGGCVETKEEWNHIQIRVGSVYWHKDGTTHVVKEFRTSIHGALKLLRIFPFLAFNAYINKVLLVGTAIRWKFAHTVDWYMERIREHVSYCYIESWTNGSCNSSDFKLGEISNNNLCRSKSQGRPLVSNRGVLLGYQVGFLIGKGNTSAQLFLNLQEGYYAQWIHGIITNKTNSISVKMSPPNITICRSPGLYACKPLLKQSKLKNVTSSTIPYITTTETIVTREYIPERTSTPIETTTYVPKVIPLSEAFKEEEEEEEEETTLAETTTTSRKTTTKTTTTTTTTTTTEEPMWDLLPVQESDLTYWG